jgi:glycosyltransferase involved in cell wall biosynthesis
MIVAYDNIVFGLQRVGGISVYWAELLKRAQPEESVVIDSLHAERNLCWQPLSGRFPHRQRSKVPVNIERYLPVRKLPRSVDVFHSSYYRRAARPVPTVVTVYDFVYERFRSGPARHIHTYQKLFAIREAQRIICISESTRRDLLSFCGKEHSAKTTVIHLGVGGHYQHYPEARRALADLGYGFLESGRPYLLFVGERARYKNFEVAVEAMRLLPNYDLVTVGGPSWGPGDAALVKRIGVTNQVHAIGRVTESMLPLWYSGAHALLYLSSYEGFGLPVLEAAMCRCPVVAAHASSIPEVHGYPSFLLRELTATGVQSQVERLEEPAFRAELVHMCGAHASRFTWDRCWAQTQQVYSSARG